MRNNKSEMILYVAVLLARYYSLFLMQTSWRTSILAGNHHFAILAHSVAGNYIESTHILHDQPDLSRCLYSTGATAATDDTTMVLSLARAIATTRQLRCKECGSHLAIYLVASFVFRLCADVIQIYRASFHTKATLLLLLRRDSHGCRWILSVATSYLSWDLSVHGIICTIYCRSGLLGVTRKWLLRYFCLFGEVLHRVEGILENRFDNIVQMSNCHIQIFFSK